MAIKTTGIRAVCRLLTLSSLLSLGACVAATAELPDPDADGAEPERGHSTLTGGATVTGAVSGSCSTTSVQGLSEQIVAQMNCISPNAMAPVPARANLSKSAATFAYMQAPARDALVAALDANPSKALAVNSMFRTVAQQYLLSEWGKKKKCGVKLAAKPGSSNHESGLALDTNQYSTWRTALETRGFKWFGSKDEFHFDYVGSGKVNLKGVDVKAFQMLWNRNNPQDLIAEDGAYGPATAARLAKSPAEGFTLGATCSAPSGDNPNELPETAPEPEPENEPNPPSNPPPDPAPSASCSGLCNSSSPVPGSTPSCYCDSACTGNGDCCSDYTTTCSASPPPPPPNAPSCNGLCGSSTPAPGSSPSCYCDSACTGNGDCCSDASSLCGF